MRHISLTAVFQEYDDGRWTAECRELGTATFGDSLESAREKINEAIRLHVDALGQVGELERFLRDNGVRVLARSPQAVRTSVPIGPRTLVQALALPVR